MSFQINEWHHTASHHVMMPLKSPSLCSGYKLAPLARLRIVCYMVNALNASHNVRQGIQPHTTNEIRNRPVRKTQKTMNKKYGKRKLNE